jgi:hypothetical protein
MENTKMGNFNRASEFTAVVKEIVENKYYQILENQRSKNKQVRYGRVDAENEHMPHIGQLDDSMKAQLVAAFVHDNTRETALEYFVEGVNHDFIEALAFAANSASGTNLWKENQLLMNLGRLAINVYANAINNRIAEQMNYEKETYVREHYGNSPDGNDQYGHNQSDFI